MISTFSIDFGSDYRLDADGPGFLIKPYRPGELVVVGECHRRHAKLCRFHQQPVEGRGPVEKAVLRMDMKVNKTHVAILVEDFVQEPLLPEPVKLIGPGAGVPGDDADKEAYGLLMPPLRRFPPPADDLLHAVEALPPDEGIRQGIFIFVNLNRLTDELGHM